VFLLSILFEKSMTDRVPVKGNSVDNWLQVSGRNFIVITDYFLEI